MRLIVPVEGPVLERVLDLEYAHSAVGLNRRAYAQLDTALSRTAWGRQHRRRVALVQDGEVLACAMRHDLDAMFDGRPVRVCAIGELLVPPAAGGDAGTALMGHVLDAAARDGVELALGFSDTPHEPCWAGFDVVPMTDVRLTVAEPARYGAPMALIRGGEERDLAAIANMGRVRAGAFRFHLDRDADVVHHAVMTQRLLAGLGTSGARELHFFIAEEGITAAAYVVIDVVGDAWSIQECGDRDPSGARVGAILQALIARAPAERRPTITGWLPHGFVPPQVTIAAEEPSGVSMRIRRLGSIGAPLGFSGRDVLYWRADLL